LHRFSAQGKLLTMKRLFPSIFILLSIASLAVGQVLYNGGGKSDLSKDLAKFNSDVAAWNKRCKITKTPAEEAWCKKERVRIDAKKAELTRLGAIPK
jgi:hypothetical protein